MNIDELLKTSMKDFKPEAPDVWSSISGQLGQTVATKSLAAKVISAVKGSTVAVKVAIVLALPTSGLIGYEIYQAIQKPTPQVVIESPATEAILQPSSTVVENNVTQPVEEKFPEQKVSLPKATVKNTPQNLSVTAEPEGQGLQVTNQDNQSGAELKALIQSTIQPEKSVAPPKKEQSPKPRPILYNRGEKSGESSRDIAVNQTNEMVDPFVIPNVFTPFNEDGKNDRFVIPIENEKAYHLRIYNEKEQLIFESFSKENTWDGRDMRTGIQCDEGDYTYLFIYERNEGQPKPKRGTVKLIR